MFTNILNNSFKVITVESFVLISLLALLTFCVFAAQVDNSSNYNIMTPTLGLSILTLFIGVMIIWNNPFGEVVSFNHTLISNQFTNAVKGLVLLSTISILVLSLDYVNNEKIYSFEYVLLICFSVVGMLLMISSFDLLTIYLSLELQSLCFYILASIKRYSEYSTEASFKYFVLGAFASGFLLFGFSLIYGLTGTTNIEQLYILFYNIQELHSMTLYTALTLVLVGLLFKLGAAPFHMWIPDVYEGSPTTITAFFAIVPKVVVLTLLFRLFSYAMYDASEVVQNLLIVCSLLSMVVPTITALVQTRLKRLFAYSTVAHVGYILMGIISGSIEGVQSTLLYIIIYIIMSIGVFTILLSIRKQSNNVRIKYIKELSNLSQMNPILAMSLVLLLFSMAGIPPLAGFFGKLYIFGSAINSNIYVLPIIGVISSVIGSVYYIYLIKVMYFEKDKPVILLSQISKANSVILALSVLFISLFFIYASPLFILCHKLALVISV